MNFIVTEKIWNIWLETMAFNVVGHDETNMHGIYEQG